MRSLADRLFAPLSSINGAAGATCAFALTFDDGPDPDVTPRLLNLLQQHRVSATFFLLTNRIICHRNIVQRMVAEGHEIALHFDCHDPLTCIPLFELRRRITNARRILESVSGQVVRFFRPPFGAQSVRTYLTVRSCGLEVVVWGPHAQDWIPSTPEETASRALMALKGGDILLLHDGLQFRPEQLAPTHDHVKAIKLILEGAEARGMRPTCVGELIASAGARRTLWFHHGPE